METSNSQPANSNGSSSNSMGVIIALIVIIILGAAGFMYYSKNKSTTQMTTTTTSTSPTTAPTVAMTTKANATGEAMPKTTGEDTTGAAIEEKVFNIEGKSFSFTPNVINVKKGDKVKIIFKNTEGFHDWVIDEFNAKTKTIPAGQSDTVEFTADKAGTFEFYCNVGNHRAQGMVGKLTVTE